MSQAVYFPEARVTALVDQIKGLPRAENQVVLLFIGEKSTIDLQTLWQALRAQDIPIVGGVFPGIIHGGRRYERGIVADVLPTAYEPSVVLGLNSTGFRMNHLPHVPDDQPCTALVLVDGLTKHIALFLDDLFRQYGHRVCYIGGGAGSLSFESKPCLFDNYGIYQDAALIVWLKSSTRLGVRHGWQNLRGPFVATATSGTKVQTLSNQSAFHLYSQIVKMTRGEILTKDNFFAVAKEHPLGIYHSHMDYIVRDLITFTDDEALVCVGEVPPRSLIYVLKGNKAVLIENAHLAACEASPNEQISDHYLMIDCISRVLYLEDAFEQELRAVLDALPSGAPAPYGVLSLGEIATFMTGRVEFFNKTIVVGALNDLP